MPGIPGVVGLAATPAFATDTLTVMRWTVGNSQTGAASSLSVVAPMPLGDRPTIAAPAQNGGS